MPKHSHLVMEKNHMEKLYSSDNFLIRFFHNQRLNSIVNFVANLPKKRMRILDAGCGEGHLLEAIHKKSPHAMLYGADITRVAIKSAKKRLGGKARISIQDIAKLRFPKGYFDAVICSDVLEHVYNYKEVISELKRVTRKQGLFIVSYPNEFNLTLSRFFLAIKPAKAPDHVNSLTPWKIKKQVGLSLTKQLSLPLNLPFVFALECVQVFKR